MWPIRMVPSGVANSSPCSSHIPRLRAGLLCGWGLLLWLFVAQAPAADVTLTWQDPNNAPAEVGGYNLYYWQATWEMPQHVSAGKQTTYTARNLEAGKTYYFAITAYDVNGGRESVYSNTVSKTTSASDTMPPAPPTQLQALQ
jgi:Fibronectin type III domain